MRIVISCLLIIFLVSCSNETTYQVVVTNNTDYKIDEMEIDQSFTSVNPHSTSEPVSFNYKNPIFAMSEPLLSVRVAKYSDSIQTYDNKYGGVISISDLEEKQTNYLNLELDTPSHNDNNIFRIRVVD